MLGQSTQSSPLARTRVSSDAACSGKSLPAMICAPNLDDCLAGEQHVTVCLDNIGVCHTSTVGIKDWRPAGGLHQPVTAAIDARSRQAESFGAHQDSFHELLRLFPSKNT